MLILKPVARTDNPIVKWERSVDKIRKCDHSHRSCYVVLSCVTCLFHTMKLSKCSQFMKFRVVNESNKARLNRKGGHFWFQTNWIIVIFPQSVSLMPDLRRSLEIMWLVQRKVRQRRETNLWVEHGQRKFPDIKIGSVPQFHPCRMNWLQSRVDLIQNLCSNYYFLLCTSPR